MAIISQETWDKFTPDEQTQIQELYKSLKKEEHCSGRERGIAVGLMCDKLEKIFNHENLQPLPLTYEDVARELFKDKRTVYITSEGKITDCLQDYTFPNPNNCTSKKQAEKLLAINRLLSVAKFLNKDWKPDWRDLNNEFYTLGIDPDTDEVRAISVNMQRVPTEVVYFWTENLAKQTVQILGPNVIRLALSNDW